jgi:hypothetical protein
MRLSQRKKEGGEGRRGEEREGEGRREEKRGGEGKMFMQKLAA